MKPGNWRVTDKTGIEYDVTIIQEEADYYNVVIDRVIRHNNESKAMMQYCGRKEFINSCVKQSNLASRILGACN